MVQSIKNNHIPILLDEYYQYIGIPPPSVQSRLANHKQGNRLPRGKRFDEFRCLEVNLSAGWLGRMIVRDIRLAAKSCYESAGGNEF